VKIIKGETSHTKGWHYAHQGGDTTHKSCHENPPVACSLTSVSFAALMRRTTQGTPSSFFISILFRSFLEPKERLRSAPQAFNFTAVFELSSSFTRGGIPPVSTGKAIGSLSETRNCNQVPAAEAIACRIFACHPHPAARTQKGKGCSEVPAHQYTTHGRAQAIRSGWRKWF